MIVRFNNRHVAATIKTEPRGHDDSLIFLHGQVCYQSNFRLDITASSTETQDCRSRSHDTQDECLRQNLRPLIALARL